MTADVLAMRREAREIQQRRPDVIRPSAVLSLADCRAAHPSNAARRAEIEAAARAFLIAHDSLIGIPEAVERLRAAVQP